MSILTQYENNTVPKLLYIDSTNVSNHVHCMHKHKQILEILLIQSGSGLYCVENEQYSIEAGDIIICNANSVHDQLPNASHPYITHCIGMTNVLVPGLPPNCLIAPHSHSLFRHVAQFYEITTIVHLLERHLPMQTDIDCTLCNYLYFSLLELVNQMVEESAKPSTQDNQSLFCQIKSYIDEHYCEEITLADLSSQFYISPYYLSHLFKQHFSYSVRQYVIRRRIGEAQSLLMRTKISVTNIAQYTGFSDASYFSKLFYKYVGMSPLEYRKYRSEKAGNIYF